MSLAHPLLSIVRNIAPITRGLRRRGALYFLPKGSEHRPDHEGIKTDSAFKLACLLVRNIAPITRGLRQSCFIVIS